MSRRDVLWLAILLATLCGAPSFAVADELVVAGGHQVPNPPPFVAGSGRFQFVYGSALFGGPLRIHALAFAPTADVPSLTGTIAIQLGVTTRAVDALTADLDSNATGALTEVFDQGVSFTDVFGATESFGFAFPFERPFDYDPAEGNLLVDVLTFDIAFESPVTVSSRNAADDLGSRAVDHPDVGNGADTISPRILFTVPESAGAPAAVALGLLAPAVRRARRAGHPSGGNGG